MAGNKIGGQKATATIKKKYGDDYYVRIGEIGGKAGNTGGFYRNSELARIVGKKGGLTPKRSKAKELEAIQAYEDRVIEIANEVRAEMQEGRDD